MSENTQIEWCDHTFNPWIGCRKVSPGCANCYAEKSMPARFGGIKWGAGEPRKRTAESTWKQPLKWNRDYLKRNPEPTQMNGRRPRVFCASLADWLDPEVPIGWLIDLLDLIRQTPHLDWLLLTKRPELWRERLEYAADEHHFGNGQNVLSTWINNWLCDSDAGDVPAHVWIGTTVENQSMADLRIPELIGIPAQVRFLSCEPLLGPLELACTMTGDALYAPSGPYSGAFVDWVICGGESGPNARPMHPDWARAIRDQCAGLHHPIPFLFKQWGEWHPESSGNWMKATDRPCYGWVEGCSMLRDGRICLRNSKDDPAGYSEHVNDEALSVFLDYCHARDAGRAAVDPGYVWEHKIGKKKAGRLLDGVEHNGFPEVCDV